ncbi:MAG: ABC transporter permease subunit [Actinomycetota bacterium]|nr:ABC transporter permease subunit [Actinomycetota bacterium]
MSGLLRAELLKLRTTKATSGLIAGMVALISLFVLVHGFVVAASGLRRDGEMHVFGWGGLGALFAALLGALSITGELRQGTIRPTLLTSPRRRQVLTAKLVTSALAGAAFGLAAETLTLGLGSLALSVRGIPMRLDGGDIAQLLLGGTVAAGLWATLGLGVGALLRNQVTTVVGLCAWLLLVESVLLGQLPDLVRYFPGTVAGAISGTTITGEIPGGRGLLAPVGAALLLGAYATFATIAGMLATERRDIP